MTHTQGPWKVAPIKDEASYPTSIWAQSGAIWIAEMKDRALMRDNPNARLIAAAPDLLAALEAILGETHDDPLGFQDALSCYQIREFARAAIAKATNEEA